jgi:hypothetical protein
MRPATDDTGPRPISRRQPPRVKAGRRMFHVKQVGHFVLLSEVRTAPFDGEGEAQLPFDTAAAADNASKVGSGTSRTGKARSEKGAPNSLHQSDAAGPHMSGGRRRRGASVGHRRSSDERSDAASLVPIANRQRLASSDSVEAEVRRTSRCAYLRTYATHGSVRPPFTSMFHVKQEQQRGRGSLAGPVLDSPIISNSGLRKGFDA